RDGEYLAASLHDSALPGRRDPVLDAVADPRHAGPERGLVGHYLHLHLTGLLGGKIEEVEAAPVLEDYLRRPDRGEGDVVVREVRDLPELLRPQVVSPDVVPLVRAAVGEEVERRPMPHRVRVVAL